ncbi:HalOD1 output domain-containing protein [Halobaculum lipolyticum]|uniref:HalOD1 output domain-containing protein n=1 Tax=Halobaculum lipolyticum TaxID=3032001 RepID=A0ABD5WFP4_9EURY|nr:HalOD1 output domain-containing protein [Halobaculum sp. DT31]
MDDGSRVSGGADAGVTAAFDAVARVGFDAARGVYRVHRRPDHPEPVSYLVVEGVSAVTGRSMRDLDPLNDTLDPDALDAVLGDDSRSNASVRFEYAGCRIEVSGTGEVLIRPS